MITRYSPDMHRDPHGDYMSVDEHLEIVGDLESQVNGLEDEIDRLESENDELKDTINRLKHND